MRIAIVTNIPAPYRVPVFERLSRYPEVDLLVLFCAQSEPNRLWNSSEIAFNHEFLRENFRRKSDGFNYSHNNIDVVCHLRRFCPDVVITTGFNLTHLYAWMYSLTAKVPHVPMTDGTVDTERNLGLLHKVVRRVVFAKSSAFLAASVKGTAIYESYGANPHNCFRSCLCVENARFVASRTFEERDFDIAFSGNLADHKNPWFFAQIVRSIARVREINVLIMGDGPLRDDVVSDLHGIANVNLRYAGFVQQHQLPDLYSRIKLLFLPSKTEAWGVVVNEAFASGVPVLISPNVGAANELVVKNENGFINSLEDLDSWVRDALSLLNHPARWVSFSKSAIHSVRRFTFGTAAEGIFLAAKRASRPRV